MVCIHFNFENSELNISDVEIIAISMNLYFNVDTVVTAYLLSKTKIRSFLTYLKKKYHMTISN